MVKLNADLFHERYIIEPNSGCWLWIGPSTGKYGGWGRHGYAHRFSWEIHYGPIPIEQFVLHKCDVPICVNPYHLFLGTQIENLEDMTRKGRRHWFDKIHMDKMRSKCHRKGG